MKRALSGFTPPFLLGNISHGERAGFTLVEVVVALMIILITVTGIFTAFIAAARYARDAKNKVTAVNLVRQRLEELRPYVRQDTWNNPANLLYAPPGGTEIYPDYNYAINNFNYTVGYTVTADATNDRRTVEVKASWNVTE